MKSVTGYDTNTRTRSIWLTLTSAGLLWVGACVWAFSTVDFDAIADAQNGTRQSMQAQTRPARMDEEEMARMDTQAAAARQREQATETEADTDTDRLTTAALEAEEQARLEAQGEAAERRRMVAEEEVELAAEARAAEQERLEEVSNARQLAALTSQSSGIDEAARKAAAAEASRIAALAREQRNYVSSRDRELGVLSGLSSRLQFAQGSATVSRQTERILDDIFNPLYLYSEAFILISVATNEYDGARNDGLLSRDRGRAIASYLIDRGLDKERFRIHIESGEELSVGTHRVRVSSEEVRK